MVNNTLHGTQEPHDYNAEEVEESEGQGEGCTTTIAWEEAAAVINILVDLDKCTG